MTGYPVRIEPDGDGFLATFRDIPEAITGCDTREATLAAAQDALITAMDFYFEDKRAVPDPSAPEAGEELVELPLSVSAKVMLLNEMITNQVRPVDLARLMHIKRQEVTRITDLKHSTKVDSLVQAFNALGKQVEFRVY